MCARTHTHAQPSTTVLYAYCPSLFLSFALIITCILPVYLYVCPLRAGTSLTSLWNPLGLEPHQRIAVLGKNFWMNQWVNGSLTWRAAVTSPWSLSCLFLVCCPQWVTPLELLPAADGSFQRFPVLMAPDCLHPCVLHFLSATTPLFSVFPSSPLQRCCVLTQPELRLLGFYTSQPSTSSSVNS